MILLDTNILIEILKNNQKTIKKVQSFNDELAISSITSMELIYGTFNKAEIRQIEAFLLNFKVIWVDYKISKRTFSLIKEYSKSHNLDIPDSLIASTAIENGAELFTYNLKDFQFIKGLKIV